MKTGDKVYIPFWVIQEYLDAAPHEPFIYCEISKRYTSKIVSTDTIVDVCDLKIKQDLEALSIPTTFLIVPEEIEEWANKIGDWFRNFPKK